MDKINIAVRAFTKPKKESKKRWHGKQRPENMPVYSRVLFLDTETQVDEKQAITFGSFVIRNEGAVEQVGLFYDPATVTAKELKMLHKYCQEDQLTKLYSLEEFIDKIFYPLVYKERVPLACFNMPFDLSRLSVDYGYARSWMKGGFKFQLSRQTKWPQVMIKKVNSVEAFIHFEPKKYSRFRGHLIDAQTVAAVLKDRRHISLEEACKTWNAVYQKLKVRRHGKVTLKYIKYNVTDTLATAELFFKLKAEYERYGVSLPLTKVYSSASIGKAALKDLGIKNFREQNSHFPEWLLGMITQGYFGGRCECRVRKKPVKVSVLDFTSMYPTLFILLGLQDFLLAERIDWKDDTENVKKFLENITIEDLQKPETWKKLAVIVELEPDDDLLPCRAYYNPESLTVGFNYLTSHKALYYCLASVVLAKLLTGKMPKIKKAIRFEAHSVQDTLKQTTILGMKIDPMKDNIFKLGVEEKQKSKQAQDGRDKAIKIFLNATAYGIFIELNREPTEAEILVYSGNEMFEDFKRVEKEGNYYNPLIATLITDGAKLLLGLGDYILQKHNDVVVYCDTDSLYVPPKYKNEIIKFFDPLNPYDKTLVKHLLKVEDNNIWFYGLSAKRYVLYKINKKGNFIIKDEEHEENYSLHGLGHLLNPFNAKEKHWHKKIWLDILKVEYKQMTIDELLNKYRGSYAISQFTVSTPNLMNRFGILNKDKPYQGIIKPFNFFSIGFGRVKDVKPIAPYTKNPQAMPYAEFINYKDGAVMRGEQYFKPFSDELWDYLHHPESKLEGNTGILQRRHIIADRILFIGKEADKIEENMSGLDNVDYNIYTNPENVDDFFSAPWSEATGMPRRTFFRIKKLRKEGKRFKPNKNTRRRLRKL